MTEKLVEAPAYSWFRVGERNMSVMPTHNVDAVIALARLQGWRVFLVESTAGPRRVEVML